MLSHELGELAVETGIFLLYEVEDGVVRYYGKTKAIVDGRQRAGARVPPEARALRPLRRGGPGLLPAKVDEMWEKWELPGIVAFRKDVEKAKK